MPPKRFHPLAEKGYIGEKKSKSKPRQIGAVAMDYVYERDMAWYNDIFCPDDIKEMVERRLKDNFYERE